MVYEKFAEQVFWEGDGKHEEEPTSTVNEYYHSHCLNITVMHGDTLFSVTT